LAGAGTHATRRQWLGHWTPPVARPCIPPKRPVGVVTVKHAGWPAVLADSVNHAG
jgi:hypothetical protein